MSDSAPAGAPFTAAAYRNIGLLAVAQAISGSSQSIVIAVAALTATVLAPDPALATLPMTATILGLAIFAVPATRLIYRLGRTRGFVLGASIAVIAGLGAGWAVSAHSFWLFCAALVFVGASASFGQQYRFAIADSVPSNLKARAISLVLLGGVAAGFIGPGLSIFAKDLVAGAEYAGSFFGIAGLSAIAFAVLSFTRLAPIRRPGKGEPQGRSTAELIRSPSVFVPIITGMLSYSLMTLVMVAAPLAMVRMHGHSPADAAGAIQWHIVAMFLPSLFTGSVVARIGAPLTVAIGLLLFVGCALIHLNGTSVLHFDIGLVLLGLGWNFGFVGSTAMLATAYRPEEAERAQSLNEPLVFGAMALASIGSGVLLQTVGWQSVNVMAIPIAALGLVLLAWTRLQGRPAPAV